MKKLLILMLVLGMTSVASALPVYSWSTSAVTVTVGTPVVVQIVASNSDTSIVTWIDDTDGSVITSIVALTAAGDDAVVQDPTATTYTDWWTIESKDTASPFNIAAGDQYDVTLDGILAQDGNTYSIYLDTYGSNAKLDVSIVPEPVTIALLGLGGLFLRRRKVA